MLCYSLGLTYDKSVFLENVYNNIAYKFMKFNNGRPCAQVVMSIIKPNACTCDSPFIHLNKNMIIRIWLPYVCDIHVHFYQMIVAHWPRCFIQVKISVSEEFNHIFPQLAGHL